MLSVVLYGRNDSHGYNLHKRAAISLNAIAELLDDPDDEILFVDYNTPDDLPTFPEAIADTLTAKAAERLKVIRVRPAVHRERYAARTHLEALEPIARNAAIRRSNPNNRWVLSTNTDMIFCPRQEGRSLSDIVGALADGFYHLPRFELPEGLWEALDRKDAAAIVSSAREWGERYHLNEIVYADRDNVYDAPGDFQLFLRQDLFDIGGFHEDMILGWHLDANMAKRMRLLRGKVSTALDHLIGYHCDHTRQATAYHRADRQENDQVRFDDLVSQPEVPEQLSSWGLPDEPLEVLRLGQASHARYRAAADAALEGPPLTDFLESQYKRADYGRLDYRFDHMLPYLLDVVSCVPPTTRIAYVGARPDTFAGFLRGWTEMGGAPVAVLDEATWLPERTDAKPRPLEAWLDEADLFLFEVGAETAVRHADLTPDEAARLWVVDHAFKAAADRDLGQQARGDAPRRVIVINGVHNFFEPQMNTDAAMTLTPYSSRVRHGYFADRAWARRKTATSAERMVTRALGALAPPTGAELTFLSEVLDRAKGAKDDEPAWREAGRVGAELSACLIAMLIDAGDDVADLQIRVNQARPSRQTKAVGALHLDAGRAAAGRLARVEDWDDPEWRRLARRLFSNRDHAGLLTREDWVWERVTLAQNLAAALPASGRPTVLVAGRQAEPLAFALARLGYRVDIANPEALSAGKLEAVDWRAGFAADAWVSPEPVGVVDDRAEAIAQGFRYDAALLVQNGLMAGGRAGAPAIVAALAGIVREGGHVGLATVVQPLPGDSRLQDHALPYGLTTGGAFAEAVGAFTPLKPIGAFDSRLTPRTFDRQLMDGVDVPPPLVRGGLDAVEIPAVFAFRREDNETDLEALSAVMLQGHFGGLAGDPAFAAAGPVGQLSQFDPADLVRAPELYLGDLTVRLYDRLNTFSGLVRTPTSIKVPAGFGAALVAGVSLGRVDAGQFELDVDAYATAAGPVLAVALVTGDRILSETLAEAEAPGNVRLSIPLEIGSEGWRGLAILLKSATDSEFEVMNLMLR
jgi:hypothetical protein